MRRQQTHTVLASSAGEYGTFNEREYIPPPFRDVMLGGGSFSPLADQRLPHVDRCHQYPANFDVLHKYSQSI